MSVASASALPGAARPQSRWLAAWPLYPLIVFLVVFLIYPVVQLLWLSFTDPSGHLSLVNYTRIATTPVYLQVLAITFKIAGWTTVFTILAGYPVAYLLATLPERRRDALMLLVLMPFWTSFLVRTFAWMVLLGRNGAVNRLLVALGVVDAPVSLIYNFSGVMIGMVQGMMPLAILTMVAVMQNIDATLAKAAHTLGARGGQAFWRIYFPLSLPGVAAAGLLVFITSLGFFIIPALLGGAHETMISQVIISVIQELMNWRFAGALSLVLLGSAALVFYLYDRVLGMFDALGRGRRIRPARRARPREYSEHGRGLARRACDSAFRLALRPRRSLVGARSARQPPAAAAAARARRAVGSGAPRHRLPRRPLLLRDSGLVHRRQVR